MEKKNQKKWLTTYRNYDLILQDKVLASLIGIFSFVFYILHLTPGVSAGDNGELTSAVFYLGVAHAPGYPIHTFFAKMFTFIPWGNVAWRVNLFSAFCGALTVFFATLVYLRILFSLANNRLYIYLASVVGGITFLMSKSLWGQSVTTEVYTISALFHPLMLYILLKWQDAIIRHQSKDLYLGENFILVFGLLLGIGLGGHQTIIVAQLFTLIFLVIFILFFQVINRPNYRLYTNGYQAHFGFVLFLITLAWGFYFYYIVRYQSNLFHKQYVNLKTGITVFVICYILLLLYYLYYRILAPQKIAQNQLFHRLSLLAIKFFGMIFLGFTIYFYIFIRAHDNPPLNWGGINELSTFWGKLAKFFTLINRKQFPPNTLPFSFYNLSVQLNLLFSKTIYSQFSIPFFLVIFVGIYDLFKRCRLWLYLFIFAFLVFNFFLTIYINFDFTYQHLFYIEIFYIYAYFILSLFIPLGVYSLLSTNEKVMKRLFLKKKLEN